MSEDHMASGHLVIDKKVLILIIIVLLLCLTTVISNGFIVVALGMEWLLRRTLSPYNKLLVSLGASRFGLQWVVIGKSIYAFLYPTALLYDPVMQFLSFLWDFLNAATIWSCTWLSFFYCVKIANFTHPTFLWLKGKVSGWIPLLLLSSVGFAGLTSILFFIGNHILYQNYLRDNCQYWNATGNSMRSFETFYFFYLKLTTFSIPVGVFLIFTVFLLISLGRHMKKTLLTFSGFQDPPIQAHIRALLAIILFAILFTSGFLALVLSSSTNSPFQEVKHWLWQIVSHLCMAIHSLLLLLSNPKLRAMGERGCSPRHQGNLLHGIRFNHFLREDAPDETFQPVSARADRPSRQPSEDCFATTSSPLVSQAPSTEHLPPPPSTLSPDLKTFPDSVGSHSPLRASSPSEPSILLGCLSPQPFSLSSSLSHSPGPMASQPLLDPSLALPQWDSSPFPLGTIPQNSSPPNNRSLPSPVPAISIFGHSNCPISALSQYQQPPRALCCSSLSNGESKGGDLNPQSPETSFLADTPHRQVENGSSYFLDPDVQKALEILITKKVKLKICKNTNEKGQDIPLYSLGNMLKSLGKDQDSNTQRQFWKTKGEAEQLPVSQQLFYPKILRDDLQQKRSQLFWGLPILHSESLVDNIRVPGASLEFSPILFNGLCNYVPAQFQANASPQLFSPRPLVGHVAQPQTLTPTLPSSQSPALSQKQTQECVPSLPTVSYHSPEVRAREVSSPTNQKGKQYPVSPTIQHLQHRFLKKPKENRVLPPVVMKSQKVFSQPAEKHRASQENKSSVKRPVDVIYSKVQEQLEKHLQDRFTCGLPHKDHLSLDKEKDPGRRQTKENCGPSQTSVISDKSSEVIQKTRSGSPEISQVGKYSSNDLEQATKVQAKVVENCLVNDPESISEVTSERNGLRLLRSDSGNDSARGPDKNNLEDSVKVCPRGKVEETGGRIPMGADHSTLTLDHACDPPENSNTPMETGIKPSLNGQEYGRNTQDLSLFHPGTQQMLEAHMKRFWVRHRWGLAFKVIKVLCTFKLKRAHASLLPQPASSSSASDNSKADSTCQNTNFLGEPSQKIPGEMVKAIMSVLKTQVPLTGRSLKCPLNKLSGDNHGPSEAPPTGQETSLSPQPDVYCTEDRAWHPDTVPRPERGSLGPSPIPVMSSYDPQQGGVVVSRDPSHHVSVGEMDVGSRYSRDRDIKETVETEEKKPFDWAVTKGDVVMSTSQNLNVSVRSLKSLGSNKSLLFPRIPTLQDPGDSRLSPQAELKKKTQDAATGVLLQDFATGKVLQDSGSGILLTEDILASQAHPLSTRGVSTSSTSRGICDLLTRDRMSQKQTEPRISKLQDPQNIESSTFGPPESGEGFASPRRMIATSPSLSRGICDLLVRDRMGQEEKEPRMPKPQEPRMSRSRMFVPPEKRESFDKPKAGGKEGRFVGGRGVGGLIPPSQVREVKDTMGSKSVLLSEKKQAASESTSGNRVRNSLQHILPNKDRGEAESLQKVKPPATATQSGGSVTSSRLFMDCGSIEAQVLMTTVGRIVEEKMRLHNELSASKENLQKGEAQVDRWSSCPKNVSSPQQKRTMSNTACGQRARPKLHSHLMNRRLSRDRENNPAFPCRTPGPLTGHGQLYRRIMWAAASDHPVYCPRHCALQKSVFPGGFYHASHIYPGENPH
ncbi:spermatogenesis-associated protein 31E1-like [Erethizon dorsatum]